jgi:hypothetical protein
MLLVLATHSVHNTPTLAQEHDLHNLSILSDIMSAWLKFYDKYVHNKHQEKSLLHCIGMLEKKKEKK